MAHSRHRSAIETTLPKELRGQLHRRMLEGEKYEDVALWLKDQGFEISKSAVGRYGKRFFEACQAVRQTEDMARAITSEVGEGLNLEEAATKMALQKVISGLVSGDLDVLEAPGMIGAIAKLQSSAVSREKLKIDLFDRAKRAASAVEKIAKKGGLSDAAVDIIRKQILGIAN